MEKTSGEVGKGVIVSSITVNPTQTLYTASVSPLVTPKVVGPGELRIRRRPMTAAFMPVDARITRRGKVLTSSHWHEKLVEGNGHHAMVSKCNISVV